MKYSIYYSKEHTDHLVWNNKYNYVSNYRQTTFADIGEYWSNHKHITKGYNTYWYKAESGEPLSFDWLFDNYPDAVLMCETNSLDNLLTQFPELLI